MKSSTQFVTEKKIGLYSYALLAIGLEIFTLVNARADINKNQFLIVSVGCLGFYLLLEYAIRFFVNTNWTAVLSVIPGLLLFLRLHHQSSDSMVIYGILIGAILRLFFSYVPFRERVLLLGCFPLDGIVLYLWFFQDSFRENIFADKLLLLCLVLLTLAAVQQVLYEKNQGAYPFHFFLLIGMVIIFIPVREKPIDWTPVEKAFVKVADTTKHIYFYLEDMFDSNTYTTGYSSLDVTGGRLDKSEKPQLILTTNEKPYFVYTDYENHMKKKIRRNVYLEGGRGVDKTQMVKFINFLYQNNLDAEAVKVFSQPSKLKLEYVYLNTADEIAPANSVLLSNEAGQVTAGVSPNIHEKGYSIQSAYIDIDYGSPYFMGLLNDSAALDSRNIPDYQTMASYVDDIYSLKFSDIVTEQEYNTILTEQVDNSKYLDDGKASKRLKELALDITADATGSYDAAKRIEAYLRQYPYSTKTLGGYDKSSTMATADGMADIADRFLFDSKEGYCVHFTSAMVTLLRLSGIPARAAIGYRYVYPFDEQDSYVVIGSCAHVWPEAYIENVGWIPFEPTAAYSTAAAYTWHRSQSEDIKESTESKYETPYSAGVPIVAGAGLTKSKERGDGVQVIKLVALVVISILFLLCLLILGNILFRKIRYKIASPNRRLYLDVAEIKEILIKNNDITITDRGILTDYVKLAPEELKSQIQAVINLYYRMEYSEATEAVISEAESNFVKNIREELKKYSN